MAKIAETFDLAVRHCQSGNARAAEALCRQVLQDAPAHDGAYHMLGVLALQAGRNDEAESLIRQSIALNPRNADCHFNLGILYTRRGRPAEAIECYREALRINPYHDEAHNNLGNVLGDQGHLGEAIDCYRHAVRINPRSATAHYNLGGALKKQGQLGDAVLCFRQALACEPRHADAYNNLGLTLVNLGNDLMKQRQTGAAIACYREALRIKPNQAIVYNNLGVALEEQGELTEAIECHRQALRIEPDQTDAHHNLSITLMPLGLFQEAEEHNRQALRTNPGHQAALWHRTLMRLLQGDFATGWQDYEQRWGLPDKVRPTFTRPRWNGSSLEGKTIFVYAEQGLGDTLQFVRYVPLVKERGGTVLLECQPPLTGLCRTLGGADQVFAVGAARPPFDVQVPLLSLPGIFGTTLTTIPATVPYLHASPKLVEEWKSALDRLDGFKVGIAWRGNPRNKGDRYRSIPLKHFKSLANIAGVKLVSLQVGPGTDELASAPFPVTDLGKRFDPRSLDDLAAAMANLDLIVTMETAVAHLAGALGAPVWTLLALSPDWRWLLGRADSPWYPTMRLYRQNYFADWAEVLMRVAADLEARITSFAHEAGKGSSDR